MTPVHEDFLKVCLGKEMSVIWQRVPVLNQKVMSFSSLLLLDQQTRWLQYRHRKLYFNTNLSINKNMRLWCPTTWPGKEFSELLYSSMCAGRWTGWNVRINYLCKKYKDCFKYNNKTWTRPFSECIFQRLRHYSDNLTLNADIKSTKFVNNWVFNWSMP